MDQITWRLASALAGFFARRAHWDNWERTNKLALEAARRGGSRIGQADALLSRGRLLLDQGRFTDAVSPIEASLAEFRGLGERRGESHALLSLGNAYAEQGGWQDAIASFDECLPILREFGTATPSGGTAEPGDPPPLSRRWEDASRASTESEHLPRAGDRLGEARALQRMGRVYRDRGDLGEAVQCFDGGWSLYIDLRDHLGQARALRGLGIAYRDLESPHDAMVCFGRALEIIRKLRTLDRHGEARILMSLSVLYISMDRLDEATQFAKDCLKVFEEFDDVHGVGDVRHCSQDRQQAAALRRGAVELRAARGISAGSAASCGKQGFWRASDRHATWGSPSRQPRPQDALTIFRSSASVKCGDRGAASSVRSDEAS